jgi:hypothetical protein
MKGGIRAYARHRADLGLSGATHSAVRKAIATKRIEADPDGSIDFEKADAAWRDNSEPSLQLVGRKNSSHSAPPAPHKPASEKPAGSETDGEAFLSARARRELAEARRAELKYGQECKELLPKVEVTKVLGQIGKIYSAGRESIPANIAPKLVGKTDLGEIETVLREALEAVDNRICNEIASRFSDVLGDDHGDSSDL